jgi:hypothetical protein
MNTVRGKYFHFPLCSIFKIFIFVPILSKSRFHGRKCPFPWMIQPEIAGLFLIYLLIEKNMIIVPRTVEGLHNLIILPLKGANLSGIVVWNGLILKLNLSWMC